MPASLLLMTTLHVGAAANGLAIGHFRRLQVHFGVIALLELRNRDLDMLLAGARDQELLGLVIAEKAKHGIFFHQLVDARAKLIFITPALRLDGEGDRRL